MARPTPKYYQNERVSPPRTFEAGIFRDVPSYMIPNGGVYDALNVLFDQPGRARKRGGGGTQFSGAQTAFAQTILNFQAASADAASGAVSYLSTKYYATSRPSGSPAFGSWTPSGGATSIASIPIGAPIGKMFQHLSHAVLPITSIDGDSTGVPILIGGCPTFQISNLTAGTVTANSPLITAIAGRTWASGDEGMYIRLQNGSPGTIHYRGRVTKIVSTSSVLVEPTPTVTMTATAASTTVSYLSIGQYWSTAYGMVSGQFGTSWQNRIILANCSQQELTTNRVSRNARRVFFSVLPTELTAIAAVGGYPSGVTPTGDATIYPGAFPPNNYFDVPGIEPITAVARVGEGQLLIFSRTKTYRVTGNLTTQTSLGGGVTWDVRNISQQVGCVSERSIQETPYGVVFASSDGVYIYDGSSLRPIMKDRWANQFRTDMRTSYIVYGSAFVRNNHYFISYGTADGATKWSLMCNLDTLAWGRHNFYIMDSTGPTVADPNRTYCALFWDQTSLPSFTNGQIVDIEPIFVPTSSNPLEIDGTTAVTFSIRTGADVEGELDRLKMYRELAVEYKLNANGTNAPAVVVGAQAELDSADYGNPSSVSTTLGTLGQSQFINVTAATNATPIVLTLATTHNYQSDDWVNVSGVNGNTNANGTWRIIATSGTTITLVGSYGNGVYSGGGAAQPVRKKDFNLKQLASGHGLIVDITSTGRCEQFELISLTHKYTGIEGGTE